MALGSMQPLQRIDSLSSDQLIKVVHCGRAMKDLLCWRRIKTQKPAALSPQIDLILNRGSPSSLNDTITIKLEKFIVNMLNLYGNEFCCKVCLVDVDQQQQHHHHPILVDTNFDFPNRISTIPVTKQ
jgi:hypothetical protein